MPDADPRLLTWYSLVSSTSIFVFFSLVTWNWHAPQTGTGWFALLVVSVTVTIAVLTLFVSIKRIGPFRSALIMNLEPLLATILSAPLLGEFMTALQVFGGAIMLGALVAFQLRRVAHAVGHGDARRRPDRSAGGRQRAAIVMLPSLGRGAADFDLIAKRLAEAGFRVLRPEPRGIGLSTGPWQGVKLEDLAADIAAVIEHDNNGQAFVVGHAFGNRVARMLATARPELVRASASSPPMSGTIRARPTCGPRSA